MNITKSKDGTKLAYDVYGNGPALIYITGAICFRQFSPIVKDAKTFAGEFTVYNYDRRGRGDSEDTHPYSLEREIEDLEAIIDVAGGSAFLYGHSSGAVIALEAAIRLPTKIKKITLFDTPYVSNEKEKHDYSILRQDVIELLRSKKNSQALRKFLIGIGMPKVFAYLLPLMPGWKTLKALAPTLEYDLLLTSDLPPLLRAKEIQSPVQIVYGEKSSRGIHTVAKDLKQAIPNAKILKLIGQDHMASPKVILPLLFNFFKS